MRIWVDTGHMNKDSGAVGGGYREVDRNDTIGDLVEDAARRQGWLVGQTNEKDPYTSNIERVNDAHAYGAEIFVSIHHDWTRGRQAVIYPNNHDVRESTSLAKYISAQIDPLAATESIIYPDKRNLTVLRYTKIPAVIVETARVQDPYDIKDMAEAIVKGICNYRGIRYVPPGDAEEDTVAKNVVIMGFVRPEKAEKAIAALKGLGLRAYIVDVDAVRITRENPEGDPQ